MRSYAKEHGHEFLDQAFYWGEIDNEIFECSLDEEMFIDLSQPELGKTTYRAVIEERRAQGNTEPFLIASTEY